MKADHLHEYHNHQQRDHHDAAFFATVFAPLRSVGVSQLKEMVMNYRMQPLLQVSVMGDSLRYVKGNDTQRQQNLGLGKVQSLDVKGE